MPLSSAIGELLRTLRTRAGLTQEALASRAGVSVRTVSDIECGKQMRPRAVTLRSLAEALGLADHDGQLLLDARSEGSPSSATLPPLVGREGDICFVSTLLAEQRLVTVTGPPGVGKSALARHVLVRAGGAAVVSVYVDLVDAALGEVAPTIARALGVSRLEDPVATRFVLLLDNVECALDAAHAVAAIVAAAPAGRVLVTSRRRLHVRGEHAFVLAPLTPRDGAQLLRDRAVACGAQLDPDDDLLPIALRLDGLPLAIELVAPKLRVLSPRTLQARLDDLSLLDGAPADAHARQRTMRDAIRASFDLLGAPERRVLARLATFPTPFTLSAADALAPEGVSVVEALGALIDASLIEPAAPRGGEPRYALLRTTRTFALERLGEDLVARAHVQRRFAAYYDRLALRAVHIADPAERAAWTRRIGEERESIAAAARCALEAGDVERALRLAVLLAEHWAPRAQAERDARLLADTLGADRHAVASVALVGAFLAAHQLALRLGKIEDAARAVAQGFAIDLDGHEDLAHARLLVARAKCALRERRYADCRNDLRLALRAPILASGACEARRAYAQAVATFAAVEHEIGDLDTADRLLHDALRIFDIGGDERELGEVTLRLGLVGIARDDARAVPFLRRALALRRAAGDPEECTEAQLALARGMARTNDARPILLDGLRELRTGRASAGALVHGLAAAAAHACADGAPARAARILAALDRICDLDLTLIERRTLARLRCAAREGVEGPEYELASCAGAIASLEEILDEAIGAAGGSEGRDPVLA